MATIQGVYVALFGRPADPTGLAFFNTATGNGANLSAIGDLASTPEYQDRFTGQSPSQIITAIYQSLFNRNPEQAGLSFFVAELASGRQSINTIAINILDGAKNDDLATVTAKITAAGRFTAEINDPDEIAGYQGNQAAAQGRAFLDPITNTSTPPTADQLNAAVDAATAGATPEVGSTFVLTTAVNDSADITGSFRGSPSVATDFKFSGSNELIIATTATSNMGDTLIDGSTTDKDIFQLSANANSVIATTTNIESFTIAFSSGGGDVDFSNVSGGTDVTATGSIKAAGVTFNGIDSSGITLVDTSAVTGGGVTADFSGSGTAGITFLGGNGNDKFTGDLGADTLTGGKGDDTLSGLGGADVYRGGVGNDTIALSADSGADRVIFEATAALNGKDIITDFLTTQDKLDVSAFLGETVSFQAIVGDGMGVGGLGGAGSGVAATAGVNVIYISDLDVKDQGTLVTAINAAAGAGPLVLETSSKYVIAVEDDGKGDGGPTTLFYVTTDTNGDVDMTTVEQVATVGIEPGSDYVAASFA